MATRSKEQEILAVMRQVLGRIVRETTPSGGTKHPLSAGAIEDIRQCFNLIAARERELADEQGIASERPYYTDEPPDARVVPLSSIPKRGKDPEE